MEKNGDKNPPVYGHYSTVTGKFESHKLVYDQNGVLLPSSFIINADLTTAMDGDVVGYTLTGQKLIYINNEIVAIG